MKLRFTVLASLLLLPACVLGAQQSAPYTIRSSARLVVLDVVVTNKQGAVVNDLKRADFQIIEAGKPQTIVSFESPGSHSLASDTPINSAADLARVAPLASINMIVLDEFNTRFEDMAHARDALKSYLGSESGNLQSPTTLIAAGLQHTVVLQDYTRDRTKLLAALDKHLGAYPWQAHQAAWQGERYAHSFEVLQKIANDSMEHAGHKNLIWIGGGFPKVASATEADRHTLNKLAARCINVLRDSRITLYSIDPAGVAMTGYTVGTVAPGNASVGLESLDPFQSALDFGRIAIATGGEALYGRNDVDAEIGRGIREGTSFYTISYKPSGGGTAVPNQFRKIDVRVTPAELQATTRKGYYVEDQMQQFTEQMIAAEFGEKTLTAVPVLATRTPGKPDSYRLHVQVGAENWVSDFEGEARHADIVILAAAFDPDGYELKRTVKTFRLAGAAPAGGFDIDIPIEHGARAVNGRFIVLVEQSGQMGSADLTLRSAPLHP